MYKHTVFSFPIINSQLTVKTLHLFLGKYFYTMGAQHIASRSTSDQISAVHHLKEANSWSSVQRLYTTCNSGKNHKRKSLKILVLFSGEKGMNKMTDIKARRKREGNRGNKETDHGCLWWSLSSIHNFYYLTKQTQWSTKLHQKVHIGILLFGGFLVCFF